MKMSHLLLGSLIAAVSFFATHAQAKQRLPAPIEEPIKGAKIIAISDLYNNSRNLEEVGQVVDEVLLRSHLSQQSRPQTNIFSVVRNGVVEFNERADVKTLSKAMIIYLAQTRICDINVFGECVIYDRRANDDLHVFVIGSQMWPDGTHEFIQSTFDTRLTRESSGLLWRLVNGVQKSIKERKVLFTRSTQYF